MEYTIAVLLIMLLIFMIILGLCLLVDMMFGCVPSDKLLKRVKTWKQKRSSIKKLEKNRNSDRTKRSQAHVQGYMDMARGMSREGDYSFYACRSSDFEVDYFNNVSMSDNRLERIIPVRIDLFDVSKGRTSEKYMGGSAQDWQDYYNGGLKFLSDVEDFKSRKALKDRLIETRVVGVQELDRQTMCSMAELEKLRNKTFQRSDEHDTFDKIMKDLERTTKKKKSNK